jgi:predicted ATPase
MTAAKLDSLTIHGFQSIRRLDEFPLHNLNVLIGPNGAGKSNFINYFRLLTELVEQRLQVWVQKRGGADRLLSFGIKETTTFHSFLRFGENGYQFVLHPTDDGGFVFADEQLFYQNKPLSIGRGHRESRLKDEIVPHEKQRADYSYRAISSWKIFHFHDTSDTAVVNRWGSLDDSAYLRTDAANLAAYLYRLRHQHPETYQQIRRTVQLAIPFFDDFSLKPQAVNGAGGDNQQIRLLWQQRDSDYPLWPTQLSDGSLRFICLVTALLQPEPPATLIIDEPELGLHPYALTLLGSLIRSAATRMQLIISTQSVPLVNEFGLDDLVVVEREAGASVFKRFASADLAQWLEDYTVGELWEKNILGGRP